MKLMERDPYAGVALNSELWFHIVDETDTTDDPTGSSFRLDLATLQSMIASAPTLASVLATGNESIGSDIIMSSQDDIFFENNLGTFSTSISNNKTTSANYVNYLDTNDGHLITRPVVTSLTQNYLTKANSTGQLIPSLVYDNGSGVAIGTTTITGLFNVSGGMSYFKGSDSTSSNFALKVDNSSSALLYVRNDGKVGVGITPDATLHVKGTAATGAGLRVDSSTTNNIFFVQQDGRINNFGASSNQYQFELRHDSSYNPGAGLLIKTTTSANAIQLFLDGVSGYNTQMVFANGGTEKWRIRNEASLTDRLNFYVSALGLSASDYVFTMLQSGYIGVGTNITPTSWLYIRAASTAAASLRLQPSVDSPSAPNDGDIWYVNTNDRLLFHKNTTTCEILSASAVTTESLTSDTTLTITYNGVSYKILCKS